MPDELVPLPIVEDRKYARFVVRDPSFGVEMAFGWRAEIHGLTEDGDSIALPTWVKRYWASRREASTVVWLLNILAKGKSRQELEQLYDEEG